MRSILPIAPIALLVAVAPGLPACNDGKGSLLAKQIENRGELIGGPEAVADVGDYLLENDKIRVAILGPKDSPGPGVYGGSIADVDIRREQLGFDDAQGRDKFAELFPVANLLVPDPEEKVDVKVLNSGEDGKEASIRVEAKGGFLFEALSILDRGDNLGLGLIFPNIKTKILFRTDYILRPGDRHVTIKTTIVSLEAPPDACPSIASCDVAKCEFGFKTGEDGCVKCDCADAPLELEQFHEPTSVFDSIFGDAQTGGEGPPKTAAGMLAGDFVFYSGHNGIFAPGIGYDIDNAVNQAFYSGRNTFKQPLVFDWVAGTAGEVSYAYFTKAQKPGEPTPVLNVPIFSSSATAFLDAGKTCKFDKSDDAECDGKRAWTFERYLAVGDGDVASLADEIHKVRKTTVGTLRGVVRNAATGEPSPNARVFILRDPDPKASFATIDDLAEANARAFGSEGVVDAIDADPGLDRVEDGDFEGTLPPGDYWIVARSEGGDAISRPERVHIGAGAEVVIDPALPTPATIQYRVVDEAGLLMPSKIALVSVDAQGKPLERDGRRRVYLGDGRLGNGVRAIEYAGKGSGSFRAEPGRYRIRASRGPEYGIFEKDVELESGQVLRFEATVPHEIDSTGWMSTDMHLHQQSSHDSGMSLPRRAQTVVDEHVELAIPTDHDVETDYTPVIRQLGLQSFVNTAVSAETTTIEQGHFIGFPQKYDYTVVPTHGAVDPTCQGARDILDGLRKNGEPGHDVFTIVAHPRDGFFGYIEQLGVDMFTLKRKQFSGTDLESANPVFRTASCDFDAMEVINGKRFDLVRTGTVSEVVDYNRCRARIDAAKDVAALADVCPEVAAGQLAECAPGERFEVCQHRNRTKLVWESMKRILRRTPEEQEANWNFPLTADDGLHLCLPASYGTAAVPREAADQPCTVRAGQIDDYFRYVEHGMLRTQVASSDSHNGSIEPGSPRTYFQTTTDAPGALVIDDATKSLKAGHAFATYGPFVSASVDGKTFGDVATAKSGKATLDLKVQTASWFGVDRIEVYQNGLIADVIEPKSKPQDIVDFAGKLELALPPGRDSWVVIVAMGLEDRNLMSPVYLDVPFGEVQISKVTSDAFALVPVVKDFFGASPSLPDWYPIPAYAVTNPIYLDTDGNGQYDAPLPFPEFCSKPCDPAKASVCPEPLSCLKEEQVCGIVIPGQCKHRKPWGTYRPD